jgi:S1-C subfamily serine protease
MISRRVTFVTAILGTAVTCFTLGAIQNHRAEEAARASYDSRLTTLHDELQKALTQEKPQTEVAVGTMGASADLASAAKREKLVADIKEQLRHEMGLLPLRMIRDRQASFVELYSYDNHGQRSYGTAGYLGQGYFVTVKHAVVALAEDGRQSDRTITSIKVVYKGKEIPARLIDSGKALMEVDRGDWAIIRTTHDLDLPALHVDTSFAYEFADPIFRLGNDYSKGVVVSTGYVGQRTSAGLVTSLTDGHPGVSGGGVLDQRGVLVGIPIGRMQGDYRFSFILPLRAEMLRKVPGVLSSESPRAAEPAAAATTIAAVANNE